MDRPRDRSARARWLAGRPAQQFEQTRLRTPRVVAPRLQACLVQARLGGGWPCCYTVLSMPSALHVVSAGNGPNLLFIHGSATDHATWMIQLASPLRDTFHLISYDRRGCGQSLARAVPSRIEDHADDVVEHVTRHHPRLQVSGNRGIG